MAIGVLSLVRAPTFCARLKEQFLLGERNPAFTTEYAAGIETIKSLQMEPQLKASCNGHLADCLLSGFRMK